MCIHLSRQICLVVAQAVFARLITKKGKTHFNDHCFPKPKLSYSYYIEYHIEMLLVVTLSNEQSQRAILQYALARLQIAIAH